MTPVGDYERFVNNLFEYSGGTIQDRDSFDIAFDSYMNVKKNKEKDSTMREESWKVYKQFDEDVIDDEVFTAAGGKDLAKDRQKTAKEVVASREEYEKKGADEVDLAGYDTKQGYSTRGRVGDKVVFAKSDRIIRRGKPIPHFRDKRGRFVRVKRR